jgi:hypothetical protein
LPSFRRISAFGTTIQLSHEREGHRSRPMKPQVQIVDFVHLRQTALLVSTYIPSLSRNFPFIFLFCLCFPLYPFSCRQSVISSLLFSSICFSVVDYIFLTFVSMLILLYSTTKVKPEGSTVVLLGVVYSRHYSVFRR